MTKIRSKRVTISSGVILPAKPGVRYRILDFTLILQSSGYLTLYFGIDSEAEDAIVFSHAASAAEVVKKPESLSGDLAEGIRNSPLSIHTDPENTPQGFSFIRYEELRDV